MKDRIEHSRPRISLPPLPPPPMIPPLPTNPVGMMNRILEDTLGGRRDGAAEGSSAATLDVDKQGDSVAGETQRSSARSDDHDAKVKRGPVTAKGTTAAAPERKASSSLPGKQASKPRKRKQAESAAK